MTEKILKLPDVMAATALSRSSIYAFIKKGVFPAPVPLGTACVGWLSSEVSGWISERASLRQTVGGAAK